MLPRWTSGTPPGLGELLDVVTVDGVGVAVAVCLHNESSGGPQPGQAHIVDELVLTAAPGAGLELAQQREPRIQLRQGSGGLAADGRSV